MARASRPGRRRGKARPSTPGPLRLRFLPKPTLSPEAASPPVGRYSPQRWPWVSG